ncbi:MAG: DUF3793 family protein [Clostridiales bacterium]|nr:DUF3793 family protein [Clostridiales bacterium]
MELLEHYLVNHCAPTLLGLKQANLFSCPKEEYETLRQQLISLLPALRHKDLHFRYLYTCKNRVFILTYRKSLLLDTLQNSSVENYLCQLGYPAAGKPLAEYLTHLTNRILSTNAFPHEIGFFLGYPKEDVFEFIRHGGENYKLCGYWKVYKNEDTARKIFKRYQECTTALRQIAESGIPVIQILGAA